MMGAARACEDGGQPSYFSPLHHTSRDGAACACKDGREISRTDGYRYLVSHRTPRPHTMSQATVTTDPTAHLLLLLRGGERSGVARDGIAPGIEPYINRDSFYLFIGTAVFCFEGIMVRRARRAKPRCCLSWCASFRRRHVILLCFLSSRLFRSSCVFWFVVVLSRCTARAPPSPRPRAPHTPPKSPGISSRVKPRGV